MHTCIYKYLYTYIYIYICIHMYFYMYVCVYLHTHIYTCMYMVTINTYLYTQRGRERDNVISDAIVLVSQVSGFAHT